MVVIAAVTALSREAQSQSSGDELRCALLGAARAAPCLRSVAERVSAQDLERSVSLFVRVGDLERAEQQVEQAFARGERSRVWAAMLSIGEVQREQRRYRAALDWYARWQDRAKREATPDVLAAVHAGTGRALQALDAPQAAYESYRLAVHVWRAEHGYKLADDGEVLTEYDGQRGYVVPALLSQEAFTRALRLARPRVRGEDLDRCVVRSEGHEGALRRCIRALRPRRDGCDIATGIVSPFGALTALEPPPQAHRTRSRLGDEAFHRGNSAAGEALLGMAQVIHGELVRVPVPVYRGANSAEAFRAWERATLTPRIMYWRYTIESRLTPIAQQAIVTRVTDAELGGGQVLASAIYLFARFLRASPMPLEWSRQREPDECMRAEY